MMTKKKKKSHNKYYWLFDATDFFKAPYILSDSVTFNGLCCVSTEIERGTAEWGSEEKRHYSASNNTYNK